MPFQNARFIKADSVLIREFQPRNSAPVFRKKLHLQSCENARVYLCCLGFGYCYINGKPVSQDLFTAPVSDYTKTLWYTTYDVSHLLQPGENTVAVICGNGWYNEAVVTNWRFSEAPWRDVPKFIFRLDVQDRTVLVSDGGWKCCRESSVYFNQLRMGEYYDARIGEAWRQPEYDDSGWGFALPDETPPRGVFRECLCEPIQETEYFRPVRVLNTGEKTRLYDFGQNMSGYLRITVAGKKGDLLTIRYAECINEENRLEYYGMDTYYCKSGLQLNRFQADRFLCSGEETTWSPRFAYHGFRYAEISGLEPDTPIAVQAVFVHQAVARRTEFSCSEPYINQLFHCGIKASQSNMFYALTDCPTREKQGWTNDAQASCEQLLTNFELEKLLTKWQQDIFDAMRPDGALPGIVPTSGWGYHWGNGPVSDGILFEIPYRVYLHTGDSRLLVESLPYFERYLQYLDGRREENGLVEFGLCDWAAPGKEEATPASFVNAVLEAEFCRIAEIAAALAEDPRQAQYRQREQARRQFVMERYLDPDGRCRLHTQCAVAMLLYYDLYTDPQPLKQQLLEVVEAENYHLRCGMVGMRRLLHALNKCNLEEIAWKLVTAEGYPGYKHWLDNGATTLWEKWDIHVNSDSKNHHMYSDVLSWIVKTLAGVRLDETKCGQSEFILEPRYLQAIDHVRFRYRTAGGEIGVAWQRQDGAICLTVEKAPGVKLTYQGQAVPQGICQYYITETDTRI